MSGAFRILAPFLPERVIVFIIPLLGWIPFLRLADAFYINTTVYVHPEPVRALYTEA